VFEWFGYPLNETGLHARGQIQIELLLKNRETLSGSHFSKFRQVSVSNRRIEQFHHVKSWYRLQTTSAKTAHKLQKATGVSGNDRLSLCGEQVFDFTVAKLAGSFGV
jgi:hypothetical protein